MKITPTPMSITDWSEIPVSKHSGLTDIATWKTQEFGDIRVRMVEYSAGYAADHWCSKGHVILCLSGSLGIKIKGGKRFVLSAGQSYHVGDGDPPHRSSTVSGARLFVVD